MAGEEKRFIDQVTDTELSAGDYIMVDSSGEGTRKFDLGTKLAAIDAAVTAEATARTAADSQLRQDLTLKDGRLEINWINDGKYLKSSNGQTGTASSHAVSDFIKLEGGNTYYAYASANGSGEATVCFYSTASYTTYTGQYLAENGKFDFTPSEDCYIRISTRKATIPTSDVFVSSVFDAGAFVKSDDDKIIRKLPLNFTTGYLRASDGTGTTVGATHYYADWTYHKVKAGQKLFANLYMNNGNAAAAICFYNTSKTFIESHWCENQTEPFVVPQDGYARFGSYDTIPMDEAFVFNSIGEVEEIRIVSGLTQKNATTTKEFYDAGSDSASTSPKSFLPSMQKQEQNYTGEVTPAKRYMAIGFDDFRDSDFSAIMPLFEKYNGKGTFNRIIRTVAVNNADRKKINNVLFGNHEMGDHTILHYAFPYCDALFNGQDPSNPDGSQTPYPTNAMFRTDTGNGRNAFNQLLTSTVSLEGYSVSSTWANLTDAQCQGIREHYSAMKNTTLCAILDNLSNTYLGTSGSSDGSWDSSTGKYTGGIFTGCATSANHEIWERILLITDLYYKDVFGYPNNIKCWSYPGGDNFGLGLIYGDLKYYDEAHTKLYNMNARFTSSLYTDEIGNAKVRSFTDVLREFGYKYTHDYNYSGRRDNVTLVAMSKQFIINSDLSRIDGIPYPTNRTVNYNTISSAYPASFFTTGKTKGAQMYDGGGEFYKFIEAVRHDTANGLIHGEVIDSFDTYSEKTFFEQVLRFCEKAGIEVVTKSEAYDICFNHPVRSGNLIYNPMLINSVKEILTDATNVPSNPDGYTGDCSVTKVNGVNVLTTTGDTTYLHYGIPYGNIKYSAEIKGTGTLTVYTITNATRNTLTNASVLTTLQISNSDFSSAEFNAIIKDADKVAWGQVCEGLNDKVMGLKFVYSSGLQIKNIRLEMV